MDFGTHDNIEIRYNSDNWGPFKFSFADALPTSAAIATCGVLAFTGKVKPASTYSSPTLYAGLTNVTSLLIDPDYTPQVIGDTDIYVKFKYPGGDYSKGVKHTLVFTMTLSTPVDAKHAFYFHSVKVY